MMYSTDYPGSKSYTLSSYQPSSLHPTLVTHIIRHVFTGSPLPVLPHPRAHGPSQDRRMRQPEPNPARTMNHTITIILARSPRTNPTPTKYTDPHTPNSRFGGVEDHQSPPFANGKHSHGQPCPASRLVTSTRPLSRAPRPQLL